MTDLKALCRDAEKSLPYADSPKTDVYEIAKLAFGLSKTDILFEPVREVEQASLALFGELIKKRAGGYPLQYLLGEWDFFGLPFYVREGVLIPRPETEQIAERACGFLKNRPGAVVFDICSGSGCIGLSVAANNPICKVFLFDISESAINCAAKNKERLSLENVSIINYDMFSGFHAEMLPKPDVILCNPPYVTNEDYKTLAREIFYEPKEAIVSDGDGLDFYRCLSEKWLPNLNKNGFFMFECGEEQSEKIKEILGDRFNAVTENDIYGINRFITGTVV